MKKVRFTQEQWVKKAAHVHNNKYDYSKVIYETSKVKVCIICPEHGAFWQIPNSHLLGVGCKECYFSSRTSSLQDFIDKANQVHDSKYNYSKTIYINKRSPVDIICNVHGIFTQNAAAHLKGSGCSACNSSKGEAIIREYLNSNKILFEEQKRFIDCKMINMLSFDFFLPVQNLLIEFDGLHHFTPVRFNGISKEKADFNLETQRLRDMMKDKYAKENNIKLLRIPYTKISSIDIILNSMVGK